MDTPVDTPWIAAINRLLRAQLRPDPTTPTTRIWWNQGDLAQAAGVRKNTLSELLNNKREPSVSTLAKLARALEVPACYLLMSEAEAATFTRAQEEDAQAKQDKATRKEDRDRMLARLEGLMQELLIARSEDEPETVAAPVQKPKRTRA